MPGEDEETKNYGATGTTCGASAKEAISRVRSLAKAGHGHHLPFGGKMLYLSSVLDLYNGEIVAYSIADRQDTSLVLDTLEQLPERTNMLLHSDQGSVYTSQAYQSVVKGKGITMSMSRKGTPADNAPIESFHSTLKSETFYLEDLMCTTTAIVEQTVRDYIHYYNSIRIQAKLNNQSPVDFRRLAA